MILPEACHNVRSISTAVTVQNALKGGTDVLRRAGVESARLDAEVLLEAILGGGREDLYVRSEKALTAEEDSRYQDLLCRRARREPVAYIIGRREFWSLEFLVGPEVLIPRPETELLVELTLKFLAIRPKAENRPVRALDLCTGSGAIAVSLAKERTDLRIWGTDVSPQAVRVARLNAEQHGVSSRTHFVCGDLFTPVAERCNFFDAIVSNPPYIRRGNIECLPADVRDWEPALALDGGADGLGFYRRIAEQAPAYLQNDALLLVEIGSDLERDVCGLLTAAGCYQECVVHADYSGRARAVSARKLPS